MPLPHEDIFTISSIDGDTLSTPISASQAPINRQAKELQENCEYLLIAGGTGGLGGARFSQEDFIYSNMLQHSSFYEVDYDKFVSIPNPHTIVEYGDAIEDTDLGLYSGTVSGGAAIVVKDIPLDNVTTIYKFLLHVEGTATFTVECSFDSGSTWDPFNFDEVIINSTGFTTTWLKITWTSDGDLTSYGFFYLESQSTWQSDVNGYQLHTMTSNETAPYSMYIPNGMTYTDDEKSLEIYHNRLKLIVGIDYDENVDRRTITFLKDLAIDDTLEFIQKYGYVDTSVDNQTRLDLEHFADGEHKIYLLLRDKYKNLIIQTTGVSTLSATCGDLILQNAAGVGYKVSNINETCDITVSGLGGLDTGTEAIDTWYYIWVVSNKTTERLMLSTSYIAPTLPAGGYEYYALIGAVRNITSGDFRTFYQENNHVELITPVDLGLTITADVYTAFNINTIVPPTAKKVEYVGGSAGNKQSVAPTSNGRGGCFMSLSSSAPSIDWGTLFSGGTRQAWGRHMIRYADPSYYYFNNTTTELYITKWWY